MQVAKPYSDAAKTLEVTAPTDMTGGYEFMVEAGDGLQYKVRVVSPKWLNGNALREI